MDYGYMETNKQLLALERRISVEYEKAANEVYKKLQKHLARHKEADLEMLARLRAGEISKRDYTDWLKKQTILSDKWNDMRDNLVAVYMNSDEAAQRMINDFRYDTYALHYNYGTYEVEKATRLNTSFALYDKDTVKRLIKDDPKLLPNPSKATSEKIRRGELKKWNKKQLQSVMTQAVLQGESVQQISKRVAETVSERNSYSHIRAARTMATSVSCAGRLDAYKRAESLGIKMGKTWLAAHDNHTRRSHRQYDGMTIPIKEEFAPNLMFPADPEGPPEEVYNCRCTMIADVMSVDGIGLSDITAPTPWEENFENYNEWKKGKPIGTKTAKSVVKEQKPQTFKEKIEAIKNDPTLSTEEKVMKAGKIMQDDYNKNYLDPLKREVEEARAVCAPMQERCGELQKAKARVLHDKTLSQAERIEKSEKIRAEYNALMDSEEFKGAVRRLNQARDAIGINGYKSHCEAMAERISQIRSVGSDGLNIKAHLSNSRSPMRQHVEFAYNHYPSDWVLKSVSRGTMSVGKTARGYYRDYGSRYPAEIRISGYNTPTYVNTSIHEVAHRFEFAVPELLRQEKLFYERRTAGESLQWLGAGYARSERTRTDKFVHAYMGKDYGGDAWELISMGFEYAYTEPATLAKDPDMQQWIFGLLLTI